MKFLIAASLLTIAFTPVAMANHDVCAVPNTCVNTASVTYGDCNTSSGYEYAYNAVYVYTFGTAPGVVSAGASTNCYDYQDSYYYSEGSSIGGGAGTSGTAAGYNAASVSWYEYSSSYGSGCNMGYTFFVAGQYATYGVGCPVGAPPFVPGLLP